MKPYPTDSNAAQETPTPSEKHGHKPSTNSAKPCTADTNTPQNVSVYAEKHPAGVANNGTQLCTTDIGNHQDEAVYAENQHTEAANNKKQPCTIDTGTSQNESAYAEKHSAGVANNGRKPRTTDANKLQSGFAYTDCSTSETLGGSANSATTDFDAAMMGLALEEAATAAAMGEVPIGAVVVYAPNGAKSQVIARAHNLRETRRDPSAHAEFLALQEAARELDAWRLTGCTVYVTLEPCLMCAGLMYQARINRCVWGAADPKGGALGTLYRIHEDDRLNHRFSVTGGVRADECAAILREFFANRRRSTKTP